MLEHLVDGRTDLVFDYLDAGHPATATDANGVPLIAWCAYYGDVSAIRKLLTHGASLASLGHNLDLNGAAFHGHWRLCQFLIDNGSDANQPLADTGETPLHAALCRPDRPQVEAVLRVLVAAKADPNRATRPGVSTDCFMRDCRVRGETPLHRAAAYCSEDVIDLLIAAGADKTMRDANGDSPLSWASWHLRPPPILRRLCFGDFKIHPKANWTGDFGRVPTGLDAALNGRPSVTTLS